MLSKIFRTGKTFRETCRYVAGDLKRAQILDIEGVRGHDLTLMAEDFEQQHRFRPIKEKPVFHGILSFPPGERLPDEKLVAIAREYLQEIRMTNTQFVIVKHIDKGHLHVHIVANKVDNEGRIVCEGLIIKRSIKAAQYLTRQHGLIPESGKNLSMTNFAALHKPDFKRYQIYQSIQKHLPTCENFADLEKRLLGEGITMRLRRDPGSGQLQGISFRFGNISFGGKQIDPSCAVKNLEQTLAQQQRLRQAERLTIKNRPKPVHRLKFRI